MRRGEKGQGLAEAAVALPLAVLMIFAVIQTGWIAFASSDLDAGIAHMEARAANGEGADDVAAWAESAILENTTVITADRLVVKDAEKSAGLSDHGVATDVGGGFKRARHDVERTTIRCTVEYDANIGLPSMGDMTKITRPVEVTVTTSQELEVM